MPIAANPPLQAMTDDIHPRGPSAGMVRVHASVGTSVRLASGDADGEEAGGNECAAVGAGETVGPGDLGGPTDGA